MKTRPFNLEEAKAGKKLVTRDGRPVEFVAHTTNACQSDSVVVIIPAPSKKRIFSHSESGSYCGGAGDHPLDLFLVHEPVRRDWRIDEVPANHWFRVKASLRSTLGTHVFKVVSFTKEGRIGIGSYTHPQSDLEHSADGIEWKECGVYE